MLCWAAFALTGEAVSKCPPQQDKPILSGLGALLCYPCPQCFTHNFQTFCRNFIWGILYSVPIGVIKINNVNGRQSDFQKRCVIIDHGMLIVRNEFVSVTQTIGCIPNFVSQFGV